MIRRPFRQDTRPDVPQRVYGGQSGVARTMPPVLIQPSQPGALGPEQGIYVKLPGADFPPAGARAVDEIGDANIAPGASATLVTVRVPDSYRFRMLGIGFGADDEVALRFLTWAIRADADTIPGYVSVASAVGSIRQLAEIFVVLGSSVTVTVVATSAATAALTYRFICRVRGYFWSEREA
ncbi:MAG: hypothetical protein ACREIB_14380 [Pseudomonadota bacterium]